jgi:hypothetical protein
MRVKDAGFEDVKYIQVNSDRVQWWSLTNTAINSRIL